jgi:hypothetical protein
MNSAPSEQIERARSIASYFDLREPFEACDFLDKGNINQQSYLITAGGPKNLKQYILQLLNPGVFTHPDAVMTGMISCAYSTSAKH